MFTPSPGISPLQQRPPSFSPQQMPEFMAPLLFILPPRISRTILHHSPADLGVEGAWLIPALK